jgi:hypothetical protein
VVEEPTAAVEEPLNTLLHQARGERAEVGLWARVNQILYYALGISAVVAGTVAGISATADWEKTATAIAGFVAALLAGFTTFLNTKEKADGYWEKSRQLDTLIRKATRNNLTAAEVDELDRRFDAIRRT